MAKAMLPSNGDGTFEQQRRLAVDQPPKSVTVADLNGDGRPDLVTANASSHNVSVLLSKIE